MERRAAVRRPGVRPGQSVDADATVEGVWPNRDFRGGMGINQLIGADFRYQNNRFGGEATRFTSDFWYQRSHSDGTTGHLENAFGTKIEYPNDRWNWRLRAAEFQDNYNPGLGFAPRTGIRQYDGRLRYRIRPTNSIVRTWDTQLETTVVTDRDDQKPPPP